MKGDFLKGERSQDSKWGRNGYTQKLRTSSSTFAFPFIWGEDGWSSRHHAYSYSTLQGPFFSSFFQKLEEAWTPLWGNSRAKAMRWLDASDDIFMYIYTIATRAMRRYILHTIAALNWIATSYAEDTTSLSCWLMPILFYFASESGEEQLLKEPIYPTL